MGQEVTNEIVKGWGKYVGVTVGQMFFDQMSWNHWCEVPDQVPLVVVEAWSHS
jgi:hypothetical protein